MIFTYDKMKNIVQNTDAFLSGFAQQSQFSFDASNPDIGNTVTLVSSTRSFPCDVEKDATVSTKITCYTRY